MSPSTRDRVRTPVCKLSMTSKCWSNTSTTQMVRTHVTSFHLGVERPTDPSLDLVKLKMWDPLQSLLTSQNSSDEIKVQTLWIIGTAVQNNPSAQNSVRVSLQHAKNSWTKSNLR